ncbi:hypothetical protein AZ19_4195 [Bordetella bronchiseptica E012]|uniref:N-acetyltransferase YedL n=1 Tax=Bordetella bronchiseptica 00-P-2796 TaxID=1331199 RepID=A0ABR4RB01_BORBO|nr:hypothetical protein B7P10_20220 [Bordetella bronchiseptica]KCV32739.1 hypothetical protein L490_3961 [Bordetella bronchiseptica 00-P-2796]KDC02008.1 hypothetical protein AZ18_4305 [Bordetella bronchiseptica D993]KDC02258.1 hypothetical protein AZ23_4208 [Bordetella bronchiseptica E010]KDC10852.1 hypothetical protein AZ24_4093 [Bordetella bronchiseptica E013]KDC11301.1 hypothetical protein AZ19_4195 [Bordetella bronchiseptica E012]KDD38752.1 hypothetical protein L527_4119 [Bordetella bronc
MFFGFMQALCRHSESASINSGHGEAVGDARAWNTNGPGGSDESKSALVLDIFQGKTIVAEASPQYDLSPSEVEQWVDDGKRGMENALRANPQDVSEQYEL